jgi:hypothetical protein
MSEIRLQISDAEPDNGDLGGTVPQNNGAPSRGYGPAQQELSASEWYSQDVSDVRGSEL